MWGVRRVGKTSILKHLLRLFRESSYLPVFVDMHQSASASVDTGVWFWQLASEIANAGIISGSTCLCRPGMNSAASLR